MGNKPPAFADADARGKCRNVSLLVAVVRSAITHLVRVAGHDHRPVIPGAYVVCRPCREGFSMARTDRQQRVCGGRVG